MTEAEALDALVITMSPAARAALPAILAMIMFAVALNLRLAHFGFLRERPARAAGAALVQLVGLPALTVALVRLLDPAPSVALGMIVVACCPGGTVSNALTHFARGRTALSVALTATSSVFAALLTPLSILAWSQLHPPAARLIAEIDLDATAFLLQTGLILALPLAAGMTLAELAPRLAARLRPPLAVLALVGLIAICIAGVGSNWPVIAAAGGVILPLVLLHNAAAFGLGAAAGRALGFEPDARRALTFEVGIQNSGLGLVILLGQFDGLGGAAAIAAAWGVWHLIAGGALAGAFRLADRLREGASPARDAPPDMTQDRPQTPAREETA